MKFRQKAIENQKIKIAKPVKNLKKIIKSNKLIDPWELKNPKKIQYTWKRKGSSHEASRIDYFLISNELQQRIISSEYQTSYYQVHRSHGSKSEIKY